MRTVYTVETGSYSDHRVHVVCERRVDADRIAELMGGDVEEMWLIEAGEDVTARTVIYAACVWVDDGKMPANVQECIREEVLHPWDLAGWNLNTPVRVRSWESDAPGRPRLNGRVEGEDTDRERLIHRLSDAATRLAAEQAGQATP